MQIIDGKKVAAEIREELKKDIAALKDRGVVPGLATILVGDNPASHVYVSSKIKACEAVGICSFHHPLPAAASEDEILSVIRRLNDDPAVHGILLQLPLPGDMPAERCLEAISPDKDVDGLHPFNLGQLCGAKTWKEIEERRLLVSCTPAGCILLLRKYGIDIAGKRAVVIGRSNLMGKPVSMMLLANNATVTMAHSRTADLAAVSREADILIVAIGRPKFVTREFVKPGATVLDVGINRTAAGICGDVDFDDVKDVAGWLTPVPGGVGATTITMLLRNTVMACERLRR